jgi:hypothetical protein
MNYILALMIALVFATFKFLELKFVVKEEKIDFKRILRDSIIVYVSSITGLYAFDYMNGSSLASAVTNSRKESTYVFTSEPDF